jgi:hypothetical protein
MRPKKKRTDSRAARKRPAVKVRLPGFLVDGDVGLGDAIHRVTAAIGIRHCQPCARRAAILNRWVTLSRW